MNKKQIVSLIQRVGYIVLLVIAFDRGYGLYFILGSTLILCLIYRKKMYKNMKVMSEWYIDLFDKEVKK